jgi:hypothetical protein
VTSFVPPFKFASSVIRDNKFLRDGDVDRDTSRQVNRETGRQGEREMGREGDGERG